MMKLKVEVKLAITSLLIMASLFVGPPAAAGDMCTWNGLGALLTEIKIIKDLALPVNCKTSKVSPIEQEYYEYIENDFSFFQEDNLDRPFAEVETLNKLVSYIIGGFSDQTPPKGFPKGTEELKELARDFLCINVTLLALENTIEDDGESESTRMQAIRSYISLAPPAVAEATMSRLIGKVTDGWTPEVMQQKHVSLNFLKELSVAVSKIEGGKGLNLLDKMAENLNEQEQTPAAVLALEQIKNISLNPVYRSSAMALLEKFEKVGTYHFATEAINLKVEAQTAHARQAIAEAGATAADEMIEIAAPPKSCEEVPKMQLAGEVTKKLFSIAKEQALAQDENSWPGSGNPYDLMMAAVAPSPQGQYRWQRFIDTFSKTQSPPIEKETLKDFTDVFWCRSILQTELIHQIANDPTPEQVKSIIQSIRNSFAPDSTFIIKKLADYVIGKDNPQAELEIIDMLSSFSGGSDKKEAGRLLSGIVTNLSNETIEAGIKSLVKFPESDSGASEALVQLYNSEDKKAYKETVLSTMGKIGGTYIDLELSKQFNTLLSLRSAQLAGLVESKEGEPDVEIELSQIIAAYGQGKIGMKTTDHTILTALTNIPPGDPAAELKRKLLTQFRGSFVKEKDGKEISRWGVYNTGAAQAGAGQVGSEDFDNILKTIDLAVSNVQPKVPVIIQPMGMMVQIIYPDGTNNPPKDVDPSSTSSNGDTDAGATHVADIADSAGSSIDGDPASLDLSGDRGTEAPPTVTNLPPPSTPILASNSIPKTRINNPLGNNGETTPNIDTNRGSRQRGRRQGRRSPAANKNYNPSTSVTSGAETELFKIASNAGFDPLGRQSPIPLVLPNQNPGIINSKAVFDGATNRNYKTSTKNTASSNTGTSSKNSDLRNASSKFKNFNGGSKTGTIPTASTVTQSDSNKTLLGDLKGQAEQLRGEIANFRGKSNNAARLPASINSNAQRSPASSGQFAGKQGNDIESAATAAKAVASVGAAAKAAASAGSAKSSGSSKGSQATAAGKITAENLTIVCSRQENKINAPMAEPLDTEDMNLNGASVVQVTSTVDEAKLTGIMANPESLSCGQVVFLKKFFQKNASKKKGSSYYVDMPSFDLRLDYPGGEKMAILESCHCDVPKTALVKKKRRSRRPASIRHKKLLKKGKTGLLDRMFDKIRSWF
jgi:hypothetical protein